MLAAATYMIAASGAGLATCPMEGFDEERLKKLLAIPRYMSVPAIVATGYAVEGDDVPESLRLPLVDKLSVDLFPNKLSKAKQKLGPEEGR
jgi:nitroreductase